MAIKPFVGRRVQRGVAGTRHSSYQGSARQAFKVIENNYRKFVRHLEASSPIVLYEALLPTFEKSKEYCPKDTGTLVNSGYLEVVEFRGNPVVEIGYGAGGHPDYAVAVHENLEWRHKAPTRAKWLQSALNEDEAAIQARIVQGYKRASRL